ncbi:MAG: hypothetical protein DDT34_01920 [Firmicutes bacterium]|nr:hypothetical protein [Bacillota bacterium]
MATDYGIWQEPHFAATKDDVNQLVMRAHNYFSGDTGMVIAVDHSGSPHACARLGDRSGVNHPHRKAGSLGLFEDSDGSAGTGDDGIACFVHAERSIVHLDAISMSDRTGIRGANQVVPHVPFVDGYSRHPVPV